MSGPDDQLETRSNLPSCRFWCQCSRRESEITTNEKGSTAPMDPAPPYSKSDVHIAFQTVFYFISMVH